MLRFPEHYAALCQRPLVLPDPDGQRAWLLHLRDPLHPTAQMFDCVTAAEQARWDRIRQALLTLAAETAERLA